MEDKTGWKIDMLMERLRAKQSSIRSLPETSKTLRLALMDRRQAADAADRAQLQRSLELLQDRVQLRSLQGALDRLEAIAKQLGMSYRTGPGQSCFIECDMFYVELELHMPSGQVREAKVQHEADATPQPCPELAHCLAVGDYQLFTRHLAGLLAIYKLNADRKLKARAYPALRALEGDLSRLAAFQSPPGADATAILQHGPLGILTPRKLGQPMRLTFSVTPYQLLDVASRRMLPLTVDTVREKELGLWAEVLLHSATAHKLQTTGLLTVEERPDGTSTYSFAALSGTNSCTLPASFVLKLSEPMAMSTETLDKVTEVAGIRPSHSPPSPLLPLICQTAAKQRNPDAPQMQADQPLYVTLPDQQHCYYLESGGSLSGAVVEALPFTLPSQVAQLVTLLRAQALLNTLVTSCVRPGPTPNAVEGGVCMELTAVSGGRPSLCVAFEHPCEDGLATLQVELQSSMSPPVRCRLLPSGDADTDAAVTTVLHRCLSIPVTMRALLRRLHAGAARGDVKPSAGSAPGGGRSADPGGGGGDGPDDPCRATNGGGGAERGVGTTTGGGAYQQFPTSMASAMSQLQTLWPSPTAGATTTADEKPVVTVVEESAPQQSSVAQPSLTEPVSRAESVEAVVVKVEKQESLFSLPGGATATIPSSLTITPIPSSGSGSGGGTRPSGDDRRKERRDKDRSDKKRRREDSPASASRPSSGSRERDRGREGASGDRDRAREGSGKNVSVKHDATSSPPPKKHSSASSGASPSSKSSSSTASRPKSSSASSQQQAAKHAFPSHSPKHTPSSRPPSVSPKHSSSPKHPNAGKPGLSTLRSPSPSHQPRTAVPCPPASKGREKSSGGSSSSSKDRAKAPRPRSEREAELASSAAVAAGTPNSSGGGGDPESKSPGRARKGSLSDVINKLNTLASGEDAAAKDAVGKDGRRAEFTVKPSSEGIKLTINKTKSRSSSSSPSGGGARQPGLKEGERSSPSGLKPGTTSGPASKKAFAFPKQVTPDSKPASSVTNDVSKSKLMKRPEGGGAGVRPKSDKSRSDKTPAELGSLPPLPKSLEIRKIERPAAAEPASDEAVAPSMAAAGPESWLPPSSKPEDPGSEPCRPPPPRPSPSVQIRIVKSPAPVSSPHQLNLVTSPRSVDQQSPCVIDDDLMDEALVGLGK